MASHYVEPILQVSSFTAVSTALAVFLGILYLIMRNKNLPPGPVGLPFWGYWPFLQEETIHLQLQELTKKYGDVYCFTIGGQLLIHIGSIKALKEAHVTKADCFSERYLSYSLLTLLFNKGITASNGENWKLQRKYFVQAFKEYGLTSVKDYLTGPIYDSVNAMVDTLKATDAAPINIISLLNTRSSAILRRMMFNEDGITDEEVEGIVAAYGKMLPFFSGRKILLMGNFAKYFIYPTLPGFKELLEDHKEMEDYLRKIIRRHEKTYDSNNIRDIVDGYIKERNDRRDRGDPAAEYFSEDALVSSLIQFVGDGILGITVFIAYFIHALLEYPDEQEKIYEELVDAVGFDRQVTLEDKSKLPYTNAFLQEVMRTTDFFTIFASLQCTKETTLNGFKIPKGAVTLMNLWACQRDPSVFQEPDEFKPSRYISEPGKPKAEPPVVFGVGKRSCAGELFTMMQVFLFVTVIVKNFRLSRPKGKVKKTFLDGNMEVCAHPRK